MRLCHSNNGRVLDDGIAPAAHYQFITCRFISSTRHFRYGRRLHGLPEGSDHLT